MNIIRKDFGMTKNGESVSLFTLENKNGMKAVVTNYGASLVSLLVPNADGEIKDVVLGYDTLEGYENNGTFFGNTIGRSGNRIAQGRFTIDGATYQLEQNENGNSLHSCPDGYNTKVWNVEKVDDELQSVTFMRISPDLEQGFPGEFRISVTYTLTDDNEIKLHYEGVSDKKTVANLTNHSYFNLSGHNSGSIVNHEIKINADFYTPVNQETLPTGEIRNVKDTAFDFTESKTIKEALASYPNCEQLRFGSGYDHNFVIRNCDGNLMEGCQAYDPKSRRLMICYTTKPGVQLYTGNHLKSAGMGKNQAIYDDRHAFCLETQYFPNAMKYRHFPSPVLAAGNTYHHKTVYKFSTR